MNKGLLLTASLIACVALTGERAAAQECPSLLKWTCPDNAQANTAREIAQPAQRQPVARGGSAVATEPGRQPQAQAVTAQKSEQQPQATRFAHSGKNGRRAYKARKHLAQRTSQACAEMTVQEKAALFKEILAWQNERQSGPQTTRE